MNRLRADLLLLLSAFFWGTSFLGQKTAGADLGPLTIVGLRFLIALLMLLPLALVEARRAMTPLTARDGWLAGLLGLCALGGTTFEQWGLADTSVTNAGFLTALYVVMVPFAVWGLRRVRPKFLVLAACMVCLAGAWLLTEHGVARHWTRGDALVAVADLFWASSIALIDLSLAGGGRPFFLACAIDVVTVVPALSAGLLFEHTTWQDVATALPSTLYAGASAAIAGGLQVVAQKHTPPAEAGLIIALQCVFAALAGAAFLDDRLTLAAGAGCGLILLAVVMVELGPGLVRNLRATAGSG
jgi:drug/metabolite transporter (DMT)-like permease